ncbi:hypothetical protein [Paenarthrobacter aurescens]|uniref:hypothetical protein n=1 Tax=Paenarthrobacter aurescens TaxID=43663 RepID=UPI001FE3FF66|nr:hypothetical protein [Paenarthrobacter aurescens]MDO6144524.1 hypothetical protein [Paenarthrobacter aurescens]MDO6148369.1 hypothetical protein [Paenarthrobacter aurescens]MDO6159615.1 hypothetical protein [Paenarthrobacter aurescens]MDO6164517.1 hypothetical protein [Paenarthrobacter aurescens]
MFPRAASILRSVMVAGAGTAIWMALSATAASAETGTTENHLLGSVTSSTSVNIPVPNVPLPNVVKGLVPTNQISVHVPTVTPLVEHVGGTVDQVVSAVPVVNTVVPPDTAGTVVNTVVAPVTNTVDHTVNVVVPPVNQVLEPARLEPITNVVTPVVDPIVGVVDTVLEPVEPLVPPVVAPPLVVPPTVVPPVAPEVVPPVLAPSVTTPAVEAPSVTGTDAAVDSATANAGTAATTGVVHSTDATVPELQSRATPPGVNAGVSALLNPARNFGPTGITAVLGGASSPADPATPADLPSDPAAVPGSLTGAGSGNSQNGPPSPAAAFLQGALIIPVDALPGLATAGDVQHPKPVCFDPGSSPD